MPASKVAVCFVFDVGREEREREIEAVVRSFRRILLGPVCLRRTPWGGRGRLSWRPMSPD